MIAKIKALWSKARQNRQARKQEEQSQFVAYLFDKAHKEHPIKKMTVSWYVEHVAAHQYGKDGRRNFKQFKRACRTQKKGQSS